MSAWHSSRATLEDSFKVYIHETLLSCRAVSYVALRPKLGSILSVSRGVAQYGATQIQIMFNVNRPIGSILIVSCDTKLGLM
jgi:hypothetical protein